MLTIFICSRKQGNNNSSLLVLLKNIKDTAKNPSRIIVQIKFDDDDSTVAATVAEIARMKLPFTVSHIVTTRGRGYLDLHKGYNDLWLQSDSRTRIFWVIADDVTFIMPHWDNVIFTAYDEGVKRFGDKRLFTMHQDDTFFALPATAKTMTQRNEAWPLWTAEWLEAVGSVGMIMATDAWTALIEASLIEQFGYDPRIILHHKLLLRKICDDDLPGSQRWETDRAKVVAELNGMRIQRIIAAQAHNIYLRSNVAEKPVDSAETQEPRRSVDAAIKVAGAETVLQAAMRALLGDNTSVQWQAQQIARIITRYAIPTLQRGPEWIVFNDMLMDRLARNLILETNTAYAKGHVAELLNKVWSDNK